MVHLTGDDREERQAQLQDAHVADPTEGLKTEGFIGTFNRVRINPWMQVIAISLICFCCPGMYNALSGTGGGGQVNPTVNANASVALLSCTAVTAILIAGPLLALVGPRNSILIGAWTYALYSGSLLNYNKTANAGFVIASGALLGIGSAFLWVAQGTIMTSYIPESHKGRSIALFWFIFNIGGAIGSLISFGINYHSKSATVSDSTYIAFMVIMLVGWLLAVLICSPRHIKNKAMLNELAVDEKGLDEHKTWDMQHLKRSALRLIQVCINWRIFTLFPLFFTANVFYPYQQSIVNGYSFNIRTRSLCGALYWIAQMFGGIVQGAILDMLPMDRRKRAIAGWTFLFVTGMAIWGGGYKYQTVLDGRREWCEANGFVLNDPTNPCPRLQNIDYKDGAEFLQPMFLYFFYGAYDSFWQSFCYWMMGAITNSAYESGVIVGTYKGLQACGGAMTNRLTAIGASWMSQFWVNWGLIIGVMLIALPSTCCVTATNMIEQEEHSFEEKAGSEHHLPTAKEADDPAQSV